jgi:hypothetical protein
MARSREWRVRMTSMGDLAAYGNALGNGRLEGRQTIMRDTYAQPMWPLLFDVGEKVEIAGEFSGVERRLVPVGFRGRDYVGYVGTFAARQIIFIGRFIEGWAGRPDRWLSLPARAYRDLLDGVRSLGENMPGPRTESSLLTWITNPLPWRAGYVERARLDSNIDIWKQGGVLTVARATVQEGQEFRACLAGNSRSPGVPTISLGLWIHGRQWAGLVIRPWGYASLLVAIENLGLHLGVV